MISPKEFVSLLVRNSHANQGAFGAKVGGATIEGHGFVEVAPFVFQTTEIDVGIDEFRVDFDGPSVRVTRIIDTILVVEREIEPVRGGTARQRFRLGAMQLARAGLDEGKGFLLNGRLEGENRLATLGTPRLTVGARHYISILCKRLIADRARSVGTVRRERAVPSRIRRAGTSACSKRAMSRNKTTSANVKCR
jgi:hypothetical protein